VKETISTQNAIKTPIASVAVIVLYVVAFMTLPTSLLTRRFWLSPRVGASFDWSERRDSGIGWLRTYDS
jgi:hypothetical protein